MSWSVRDIKCKSCGKETKDVVVYKNLPVCPHCASEKVEKLITTSRVNTAGAGTGARPR